MIYLNILVLDQATRNTGFCFIKDGKILKFGTVKTDRNKDIDVRVNDVCNWVKEFISEKNIDTIVLEDVQYQSNQKVYKSLSKLLGALINVCLDCGVNYSVTPSVVWKSYHKIIQKGKRNAQKEESIRIASEYLKTDVHEDTADAVCMGIYFSNCCGDKK